MHLYVFIFLFRHDRKVERTGAILRPPIIYFLKDSLYVTTNAYQELGVNKIKITNIWHNNMMHERTNDDVDD